jgi:hypothetical protein
VGGGALVVLTIDACGVHAAIAKSDRYAGVFIITSL